MTFEEILVPTDFSEAAYQAMDYAIELAKVLQAHLTLLHVFHLSPLTKREVPPSIFNAKFLEIETNIQQRMQAAVERVHQMGLQSDSIAVEGIPFQTIIDTAKNKGIDLIVMGTHGRTGLTHVFMGSVAEKVVRLAPCPVLVTRGTTETTAE